jgi:hypothetical protein
MQSRKSEYMYRWIYEQNMSADLRTKYVGGSANKMCRRFYKLTDFLEQKYLLK